MTSLTIASVDKEVSSENKRSISEAYGKFRWSYRNLTLTSRDKVWNEISKYQDNGIIRFSTKSLQQRHRHNNKEQDKRELSNSLSREYRVSIYNY